MDFLTFFHLLIKSLPDLLSQAKALDFLLIFNGLLKTLRVVPELLIMFE